MTDSSLPYPAEAIARLRERATLALERHEYATPDVVPADLAALLDYAEKTREAMRWRPIETAPKDGTHILVFPALLGVPLIASWEKPTPPLMMPRAPAVRHDGFWRAALTAKPTPYKPTHWLPLPPAPDSEAKR